MWIFHWIRSLLGLYAIMLLVHFALPYVTSSQQPWMAVLARICEPGIKIGNNLAAKVLPDRRFKIEVGPLAAVVLCYVARLVLGLFS
ncbi:MAG: YggT family protein [Clostridia bacterium]|nr:YggT family protein [Clostridia bacterium]